MTPGVPWLGDQPRAWQERAVSTVLAAIRSGTRKPLIHAATGAGKSRVIAELAATCKGSVLVTTPTQYLVGQLSETLTQRCPGEVGRCYQHAWEPNRRVVVTCSASMPTFLGERPDQLACWIVDECHKAESDQARAMRPDARSAIGLTATPYRGDRRGLEFWDGQVFSYTSHEAVADGVLVPWDVVWWDGTGDETDTDALCVRWVGEFDGPGIASATTVADADAFAVLCNAVHGRGTAESIHGYLPKAEQEMRIRRLKSGKTRCLVHVQLLTEGVDFPWLRNLILRRPVASPNRLVQEVGRVLRACPGKTRARIYDPHDLMGDIGLVHASRLEDVQVDESGDPTSPTWSIPELEGLGEISKLPKPKAVGAVAGWVTNALGALRGAGLAPPPDTLEGGAWRRNRASDRQLRALSKVLYAARYLPDPAHRSAVRWLVDQDSPRAGTISDVVSVLRALADDAAPNRNGGGVYVCPVELPSVQVQ